MELTKLQIEGVLKQFLSKENGLNEILEMVLNSLMYSEREAYLESQEGNNKGNGYRFGKAFGRGNH